MSSLGRKCRLFVTEIWKGSVIWGLRAVRSLHRGRPTLVRGSEAEDLTQPITSLSNYFCPTTHPGIPSRRTGHPPQDPNSGSLHSPFVVAGTCEVQSLGWWIVAWWTVSPHEGPSPPLPPTLIQSPSPLHPLRTPTASRLFAYPWSWSRGHSHSLNFSIRDMLAFCLVIYSHSVFLPNPRGHWVPSLDQNQCPKSFLPVPSLSWIITPVVCTLPV